MALRMAASLRAVAKRRPLGAALGAVLSSAVLMTAHDAQNDATLAHAFNDDYDLADVSTLGAGAFGMVLQCVKKQDRSIAAVKVSDETLEEAVREKTALGCVAMAGGHEHIVHMENHYTHDGFHYLVVEYINGSTLFDYIRHRRRLDEIEAKRVLGEIASALGFMHAHGMVHCDLKPDNVMLTAGSGAVKLIDFGSATIPNPHESRMPLQRAMRLATAPLSGTKSYWSPEMLCEGSEMPVEPAMDMWALGCILYIMIAGVHPFDPRGNLSEEEIQAAIVAKDVELPVTQWYLVSKETKAIVRGLLEKDPKKRLTAEQLQSQLLPSAS
ncbi:protein kinase [Achlya hypogyna]|uniref:Protein kinase n=1 Tax=Achlya hypogyna TaxID=1202772 RepID=A0A1V9ZE34_ACHHY|nr:protein kinase [Achlya hypogyna]